MHQDYQEVLQIRDQKLEHNQCVCDSRRLHNVHTFNFLFAKDLVATVLYRPRMDPSIPHDRQEREDSTQEHKTRERDRHMEEQKMEVEHPSIEENLQIL